jgi:hypothetical protein
MDIKEFIKLQILSKPDAGKTLRYLIALGLLDESLKHIGPFFNFIKNRIKRKQNKKPTESLLLSDSVLLDKRHIHNQVCMKRDWKTKLENFQETNIMVDAVLNLISKLDNIPDLQLIENMQTLINYLEKPFQVTRDIFAKVESIDKDPETGMTSSIVLVLMSNKLSSHEITTWVKHVYDTYKEDIKNALGDTLYFFDH